MIIQENSMTYPDSINRVRSDRRDRRDDPKLDELAIWLLIVIALIAAWAWWS